MAERTVSPIDLQRLKDEREDADRRYLEALAALDAAAHSVAEYPHAPPSLDEHQITPLNELWNLLDPQPPPERGIRARIRGAVWQVVGKPLQRQQQFNAALVDHINRNVTTHRETQKAIASVIALFREHLASFELHVMALLQRLTPYIDTKDLEVVGLLRRISEDTRELVEFQGGHLADRLKDIVRLEAHLERLEGFGPVINGLGDEMMKRWEAGVAREQRLNGSLGAFSARIGSLEEALSVVRQATHALKREIERAGPGAAVAGPASAAPPVSADQLGLSAVDSYKYVGFENRFRGSEDEIRRRQQDYLQYFEGARDVLDIGCGRGEFLDLLRQAGIGARGLDLNHEMVEVCRAQGLEVHEGDALAYLLSLPDESLGGLIALQVVEHLPPAYLMQLLEAAFVKLRAGSRIILETINPSCWFAFFESYLRDPTHVRAVHPETLKYLMTASGFQPVELQFRAPYPEPGKLRTVLPQAESNTGQRTLVEVVNENADKVNRLLFGYMDYAAIGSK